VISHTPADTTGPLAGHRRPVALTGTWFHRAGLAPYELLCSLEPLPPTVNPVVLLPRLDLAA